MNWLAKINLPIVAKKLGPFKSALLLFSVIGLCLFIGYRLGNYYHGYQAKTMKQQKLRLDDLYLQHGETLKRIHTLEVELDVERIANLNAQNTIKELEQVHFEVKKELAFYHKIMAPEKQADGVVIDQISIQPTESEQYFQFLVVLVQQKLKKRYAKGFIEVSINGSENGRPKTIALSKISSLTKKELSFSFQYFQRLSGAFTLPKGFRPESVTVGVVLPKGKWQKYRRIEEIMPWPKLEQNVP
ncbi:DUF6776 family protein [Thalassotalea atypica]|uniref:DUF6776 family protein n=1 Tax=Thalassotalea atypica TaxID=2054316 RepID=UPI0025742665|nr:DUF6776 family protein [Thalassotalea atypica]